MKINENDISWKNFDWNTWLICLLPSGKRYCSALRIHITKRAVNGSVSCSWCKSIKAHAIPANIVVFHQISSGCECGIGALTLSERFSHKWKIVGVTQLVFHRCRLYSPAYQTQYSQTFLFINSSPPFLFFIWRPFTYYVHYVFGGRYFNVTALLPSCIGLAAF